MSRRGATAIEYALLLSSVFLAILGAMWLLSSGVDAMWKDIETHISSP